MRIAVDAAGGEYAPHEIVKGAIKAAQDYKIGIVLVGKKEILHVQASRHMKKLDISLVDADEVIGDEESPIEAVAKKQNSSIVIGINLVKKGQASAFVSAGSTGAVMYAAFAMLGRVEGIERPAIGSIITVNLTSPFLLLDCGANPNCRPRHLLQFAQMGNIYVREVFGVPSPRIALLNNGEEEKKGNQLARDSYQLLKASDLNFVGNIEGQNFSKGIADVVVTDGFTGNIVLKTLEGLGEAFLKLKEKSPRTASASGTEPQSAQLDVGFGSLVKRIDYRESGGACLLGLNGNVIISHGRSQTKAIRNAIGMAKRSVDRKVCEIIQQYKFTEPDLPPTEKGKEQDS
ncbi:MAG: phosphate acyltransferase PlsX [Dehalococcoidales bacterium]|nr:phosphate acyltransferase PlsX [Dehalococcoidales bacterium]